MGEDWRNDLVVVCSGCGRETDFQTAASEGWSISTRIVSADPTGYWCPECQEADEDAGRYDYIPIGEMEG